MKTKLLCGKAIAVLALLFSIIGYGQTTIYSEGFETNFDTDTNGWTLTSPTSNMNWEGGSATGTPSGGTGPNGANSGSYFMFTEASTGGDTGTNKEAVATSPSIDLSGYTTPTLSFYYHMFGSNIGDLDVEIYNGGSWVTLTTISGQQQGSNGAAWSNTLSSGIDLSAYTGDTVQIRFYATTANTGNWWQGDFAVDDVLIEGFAGPPVPEIDITGLGNSIIGDGTNTPLVSDDTDFGTVQVGSETAIKTFTINNYGSVDLTLGTISLTGSTDFSISTSPTTPIVAGTPTQILIAFNTLTLGLKTAQLSIANNDSDENPYLINLTAEGTQAFFDSDGDGIFDDVDIDDDNDGIIDSLEETSCSSSTISNTVNYKFLNETFGTGGRTTINTSYAATTSYCYEDGTAGTDTVACPDLSSPSLNDGEYVVYNTITNNNGTTEAIDVDIAAWAEDFWYEGEDHTPGDTDGRMAIFNASYDPGVFYTASITGALPYVPITYDFWVINIDRTDAPCVNGGSGCTGPGPSGSRLRPNVLVEFFDLSGNLLINLATGLPASISTGDIPPTTLGNTAGDWYNFSADLTFNVNQFEVVFTNNETGGLGNDLALDDIKIEQTLCDTDGDGIADLFDLDSDDDGIADVIEVGLSSLNGGAGFIDYSLGWVDANNDGLHDSAVGNVPPDTDGDLSLDFLDLDSDNDTIFDVDESDAGNTSKVAGYENGDGDINGDGTGNNNESEAFREKDTDGDGTLEYYGDGILDIYEHFYNAYGNTTQADPVDTDGDGTPDYLDTDSNNDAIFDITTTLYASLDANNDGVIDDTNDADSDGIVDLFDTEDAIFGSPRDLDRSLYIHFDGRNDYAQDVSLLGGLSGATIMAWINIDNSFSNQGFIVGQNNFNLKLNSSRNLIVTANGTSITNGSALNTAQWIHVAAIYDSGLNTFKLYVNGLEANSTTAPSALNADASLFTIAKNPSTDTEYFYGGIEEIKVLDIALTELQLQKMIYQKVEDNGQIRGEIIPLDIDVPWTNVVRYFRMDAYKDDVIDDYATPAIDEYPGTFARCYNIKLIKVETAPMPFVTQAVASNYDIGVAVSQNNDVRGDDVKDFDWSITHIRHDINLDVYHSDLGLIVDSGVTVNLNNETALNNDWYLNLNGFIDLNGESQLVQTAESILDINSAGYIERDQQGTANSFTYNYWSSPVGLIGAGSNNTSFTLADVLRDGTTPAAPIALDFDVSNTDYYYADGIASTPRKVATYWMWKFVNLSNAYANWQWIGSSNTLNVTDGFTKKGASGTGSIDMSVEFQNHTFIGKPNNAPASNDLVHTTFGIPPGPSDPYITLTGNPFPSAIDANKFIDDNAVSTTQTLYFWEHWGGGNHNLGEYQGGYSTYTKSGSVPTPTLASSHPDVDQTGSGVILPGQYIPVAQGFYVYGSAVGGDVVFKNSQRIFEIENGNPNSNFSRTSGETSEESSTVIERIRIGFDSPDHYHRQVMVAFLEGASDSIDKGYDAYAIDVLSNDSFFMQNDKRFVIQAFEEFDEEREIPIIVIIDEDENELTQKFMIDSLENIPLDRNIFLKDNVANVYHDLRQSNYEVELASGEHKTRFSLVFRNSSLSVEDEFLPTNTITIYMNNPASEIQIHNTGNSIIEKSTLYNSLGQNISSWKETENNSDIYLPIRDLSTGIYVLKIATNKGNISKKIIIE